MSEQQNIVPISPNSSTPHSIVAIDDGFDETKIYTRSLGGSKIRSLFALNPTNVADLGLSGIEKEGVYRIDGKLYAVGNVRQPEDTRFDDYPFSPGNLAVALHALRAAGVEGQVHAVTGMPVNRYYSPDGEVQAESVKAKRCAWMRDVEGIVGGEVMTTENMPRIARVSTVSEAVAAWFDHCVDDKDRVMEKRLQDMIAIVDIGGRTTDVAVVEDAKVLMRHSGTTDHGALDIYGAIDRQLQGKLKLTRPVPRQRIIEGMDSGIVTVGPTDVDIREIRSEEKRLLAERIRVFVQSLLGGEASFIANVIFVGGGSAMLREELQGMFPQMSVADNPQYANARGMYKYGVMQDA